MHLTDSHGIAAHLEDSFEQHVQRWNGTRAPSLFNDPRNREFYRQLVREFGDDSPVVVSAVKVDQIAAACHFGFISRDRFIWYKPSYEPQLAHCGPGEVLLGKLLRFALDSSLPVFDFTRGNEQFKSRFADTVETNLFVYCVTGGSGLLRAWRGFAAARIRRIPGRIARLCGLRPAVVGT